MSLCIKTMNVQPETMDICVKKNEFMHKNNAKTMNVYPKTMAICAKQWMCSKKQCKTMSLCVKTINVQLKTMDICIQCVS